jgi:hypothetical protein
MVAALLELMALAREAVEDVLDRCGGVRGRFSGLPFARPGKASQDSAHGKVD